MHSAAFIRSFLIAGLMLLTSCSMGHMSTKELADQLDVPDEQTRLEAVWLLGSRELSAVDPLLTALNDRSPRVRAAAAISLGQLGNAAAVPQLHEHLSDGDADVRISSREALRALRKNRHLAEPTGPEAFPDSESACEALDRNECQSSVECSLACEDERTCDSLRQQGIAISEDTSYICRDKNSPCENGLSQTDKRFESRCRARKHCVFLKAFCYCPKDYFCRCFGGPPAECRDAG